MIWTTSHLLDETTSLINNLGIQVLKHTLLDQQSDDNLNFAVIGGGPKGMYAIDNFISEINEQCINKKMNLYWFNKDSLFAAGPNYNPKQSENLLINYCIGNLNAWKVNTEERLCLTDWLRLHIDSTQISPYHYASRALVGCYLMDCCRKIIDDCPSNIRLHLIAEEIKSIAYKNKRLWLLNNQFESIILCTGHSFLSDDIADKYKNNIFSAYPIENLDRVKSVQKIAIQGMGLSFIDTVIYISEGTIDDQYPQFYPFSRTNLPMIPRRAELNKNHNTFFFPEYWQGLISKSDIDFDKDFLPLMDKEIQMAYYSVVIKSTDIQTILHHIDLIRVEERFSLTNLLFPNKSLSDFQKENYTAWVSDYLQSHLERCRLSFDENPLNNAIQMLSKFRPILEKCYEQGKLTSESHHRFDVHWYPAISRICFGPPIANVEKLIKLISKGKLKFEFTECPEVNLSSKTVVLKVNGKRITCDALIYARIPRAAISKNNHPLFTNLIRQGLAIPFKNETYATGGIAINKEGLLLNKLKKSIALYAYGTPTEGCVLDNDTLSREAHDFSLNWVSHNITLLKSTIPNSLHYVQR